MKWIWKQSPEEIHFSSVTHTKKGTNNFSFCCFFFQCSSIFEQQDEKNMHIFLSRTFLLFLNLLKTGLTALLKQSAIKTPDSTSISKSITRNTRYEKEFVHILQTSELWSQLAKTFGTEAGEKRCPAPTLRWKSSPKSFMPGKFNNKLWVNLYSQNHTVLWASTRFKFKTHTVSRKAWVRMFWTNATDDVRIDDFKMHII